MSWTPRTITARLTDLVVSEVARWREWTASFGMADTEVKAMAARREDYARRLVQTVKVLVEDHPHKLLPALGRTLARIREERTSGVPEVADVMQRLRHELEGPKPSANRPVCRDCEAHGGVRLKRDGDLHQPMEAVYGPWAGYAVPRCATHHDEAVYQLLLEAWNADRVVMVGGVRTVLHGPPALPLSMR